MTQLKQLSDGNPTGTLFGQTASDLIGFYGLATPVAQQTVTLGSTSATTLATTIATDVVALKAALVALNLVK